VCHGGVQPVRLCPTVPTSLILLPYRLAPSRTESDHLDSLPMGIEAKPLPLRLEIRLIHLTRVPRLVTGVAEALVLEVDPPSWPAIRAAARGTLPRVEVHERSLLDHVSPV